MIMGPSISAHQENENLTAPKENGSRSFVPNTKATDIRNSPTLRKENCCMTLPNGNK
jgi:hypothetical protein